MAKIKNKFDWKLIKEVVVRLIGDLWVPAVIALAIEIYNSTIKWPGWLPFLGSIFTTMFFAGAYFNYLQRAKKFVIDQRNHDNVVGKQDALFNQLQQLTNDLSDRQNVVLTRFEALRDDLEGLTTGGSGFGYVWFVRTTDTSIVEFDVMVDGKFPLQEVHLSVTDFTTMRARLDLVHRTGDRHAFMQMDFHHNAGTLIPGLTYAVQCNLPLTNQSKMRLHLNWQAKNGTWYQRIQLEKIDGKWQMATFLKREETFLYSKADEAYPRNVSGEPVFNEYEH